MSLGTIFLIVALILFVLAGVNLAAPRVNLGWLGLAFFAAAFLVRNLVAT